MKKNPNTPEYWLKCKSKHLVKMMRYVYQGDMQRAHINGKLSLCCNNLIKIFTK